MAEAQIPNQDISPEESARLLSGTQKCAILMLLLGEDEASEILNQFLPELRLLQQTETSKFYNGWMRVQLPK